MPEHNAGSPDLGTGPGAQVLSPAPTQSDAPVEQPQAINDAIKKLGGEPVKPAQQPAQEKKYAGGRFSTAEEMEKHLLEVEGKAPGTQTQGGAEYQAQLADMRNEIAALRKASIPPVNQAEPPREVFTQAEQNELRDMMTTNPVEAQSRIAKRYGEVAVRQYQVEQSRIAQELNNVQSNFENMINSAKADTKTFPHWDKCAPTILEYAKQDFMKRNFANISDKEGLERLYLAALGKMGRERGITLENNDAAETAKLEAERKRAAEVPGSGTGAGKGSMTPQQEIKLGILQAAGQKQGMFSH